MTTSRFNIVVKKLLKYRGKILNIKKLRTIIAHLSDDGNPTDAQIYKTIYYLKNKGYLDSLKKNLFFVMDPKKTYNKADILDALYRPLVKKHCKEYLSSDRYVGGIKALELHLLSYGIPEQLLVVNKDKQSTEVIVYDKQIVFKTYKHPKQQENLFPFFLKYTKKITFQGISLRIASLELALLESLYNISVVSKSYVEELVKKVMRNGINSLDTSLWISILKKNKHHMSINRLYKLTLGIDPDFAEHIKKIIKRHSYFI